MVKKYYNRRLILHSRINNETNLNMKTFFAFLLSFFLAPCTVSAQCLSGDCENGTGTAQFATLTYTGQFKNGLPDGTGALTGAVVRYVYLDSVKDEGNFSQGFFTNGKRSVMKSWEKSSTDPTGRYEGKKLFNEYYYDEMYPSKWNRSGTTYDYPEESFFNEAINGKTKEIKVYKFTDQFYGELQWRGKLKKSLPDGSGKLYIGNDFDHCLTLTFDKGLAEGIVKVDKWYTWIGNKNSSYRLQDFTAVKGVITPPTYVYGGDTIIQLDKNSFFAAVAQKYKLSLSGYCKKVYNNGTVYTGGLVAGLKEGYGEVAYKYGASFKGYFFHDLRHGQGVLLTAGNEKDSGFYLLGNLMKGVVYRKGKQPQSFPFCLSGNCNDGYGKASYKTISNDTLRDEYEGNFVNGLPSGYGERSFVSGKYTYTKKGNFSAGYLNGEGTIIANAGIIRKFSGRFENDTLAVGTMFYEDGSSFEFDASYYLHRPYRDMPAVVFGIFNEKKIGGRGTYRSVTGSVMSGTFNQNNNGLLRGTYKNSKGIVLNNFGFENDVYASYRLSSVNYEVEYLDFYVNDIVAKINFDNEERLKEEKAYALKAERDKVFSKNFDNPANFTEESSWVSCSACGGNGVFTYSNTFGGNYTEEESDGKGGRKKVTYERTGRTYTTKVRCSACNGARGMRVSKKKYVGPAY